MCPNRSPVCGGDSGGEGCGREVEEVVATFGVIG